MNTKEYLKLIDELDDDDALDAYLNFDAHRSRHIKGRISKKLEMEERAFIAAQDDTRAGFQFTYKASHHEGDWIRDSLGAFYEGKWISDVLRLLKGGKEASVYLCKSGAGVDAPYLAAKVYRPRMFRNLKNDSHYRVGRQELDESGNVIFKDADMHAIQKRTAYGEKLRHQSWIAYEYQTLQNLAAAEGDVPTPFAMGNNAILMEYIGDLGQAAPTLQSVDLEPGEVKKTFERTLHNVNLMLDLGCVHGDLSAYNILYWDGQISLIDFPQVVFPEGNPLAWEIFQRDVLRVCQYFASRGISRNPYPLAMNLWRSHGHKVRHRVHPRYLDPDKPADREVWEKQS